MCFVNDADWYADVSDRTTRTGDGAVRCDECGCKIPRGRAYEHLYQQQYECCRVCDRDTREEVDPEFDGEDLRPCANGACNFGETYEHDTCDECQKLLAAIQRVEEDDGCTGNETRPMLGELREAIRESDHAVEYIDRARQEYPELAASGYLDRMYRRTREWERDFEERWDDEDLCAVDVYGGEG